MKILMINNKLICVILSVLLLSAQLILPQTSFAQDGSQFTAEDVNYFESSTDEKNYVKISAAGSKLNIAYSSEIEAVEYRIGLTAPDLSFHTLSYVTPVHNNSCSKFDAEVNLDSIENGQYYLQIARARTQEQTNRGSYGDRGRCYRNVLLCVENHKVSIKKFNTVINHNGEIMHHPAYISPDDFLNTSMTDVPFCLYDSNAKTPALTKNEKEYIKKVALNITQNCSTNYSKAKAVYAYVALNTYYDVYSNQYCERLTGSVNNPYQNIQKIENNGKTSTCCVGYASMVCALLRSLGIPTKVVYGYHLSIPQKSWSVYEQSQAKSDEHYWNEFYDGQRWVILDANMGTSNQWNRTSATSSGTWDGGNCGEKALNNYTYFNPTPEQFAVTHCTNGVYSKSIISNANDVKAVSDFLNQKNKNNITNKSSIGITNDTTITDSRILSWDPDKIYANTLNGNLEKINFSGTSSSDGKMFGSFAFSNIIGLKYVSLSYNKGITSLNLNEDKALISAYASSCGITAFSAINCPNLKTANITYNPIKSAQYTFDKNKTAKIMANTGGTFYLSYANAKHTFKAQPNRNYYFSGWYNTNGKKLSSSENYSVTSAKSFNITAKFNKLSAPTGVKITAASSTSQKISWNKVSNASGYYLYKSTTKNGKYTASKITNPNTTFITKTGLDCGKTYYYYVVAYKTISGKSYPIYSSKSSVASKKVIPVAPKPVLSTTKKTVTVKFSKVANVSGYEIVRAQSKNGSYKKVKTITNNSASTIVFKNSSLKSGKTYYYKVRAYKTVNGKKVYSDYSAVKSIKVK